MATTILLSLFPLICLVLWLRRRSQPPYPPGPPGLPVLGNALEYPRVKVWDKFSEWATRFGDVVRLNILGTTIIFLNSENAAKELLDRRSAIYSDRPIAYMGGLSGYTRFFVFMPYSNDWREQRKLVSQHFAPLTGATRYYFVQEQNARKLALELMEDASRIEDMINLRVTNIIYRVMFGFNLTSENDPIFVRIMKVMENLVEAMTVGNWTVDFLPFLQYLPKWTPGAKFLHVAEEWRKLVTDAAWEPYARLGKNLDTGSVLVPNVCTDILEAQNGVLPSEEEWHLSFAAITAVAGGIDTNIAIISHIFLLLIHHPSVQRKAYEEIAQVIGTDRLPAISDRDSLPYLKSIITEAMRYHPPLVASIPHVLRKDDIYDGFYIPKGSIVMPNIWHMCHDPERFPDPHTFKPERYENSDAEMDKVNDLVFGFGRRVCPGSVFGLNTIFSVVSNVIATCEILPPCDETGKEFIPELAYTDRVSTGPKRYKCRFTKRSEEAYKLLRDSVTELE